MKNFISILIVCLIFPPTFSQQLDAYRIYNSMGEAVTFEEMVGELAKSETILFGELHDNPISHWLQLEVTIHLAAQKGNRLVLGAEMFEADNQVIMTEYLSGLISQKRFEEETRLWGNYKTDYKPLVELAREKGLHFVATNIPRRYAAMVASGGFEALESLSNEAKSFIAPLPLEYNSELPGYKAMLSMGGMPGKTPSGGDNFPKAQAIKDATMAWFISRNLEPEGLFIHFNGTYHSNNYEGIGWYLKRFNPSLRVATIATVLQDNVNELEKSNENLAHFIIVVPTRMTRTY